MNNNQLIPASAFIVMSTSVLASVQKTQAMPGMNFWIGMAIAYTGIALVGEFSSDIGNGLAVLVMVAALMENGGAIAKYAGARTGGKIGAEKPASNPQNRNRPQIVINRERIV